MEDVTVELKFTYLRPKRASLRLLPPMAANGASNFSTPLSANSNQEVERGI